MTPKPIVDLQAENALLRAENAILRERLRLLEGGKAPAANSRLLVQDDNIVWGT